MSIKGLVKGFFIPFVLKGNDEKYYVTKNSFLGRLYLEKNGIGYVVGRGDRCSKCGLLEREEAEALRLKVKWKKGGDFTGFLTLDIWFLTGMVGVVFFAVCNFLMLSFS
mgnify:CR=1 FL=1|jgi:hypothetical protein